MDSKRRAAWESAIAKRDRGVEVPPEEHYALLREGMFSGTSTADAAEEADLFLRYWLHGLNRESLPWLGEAIANHWFWLRDWDRQWGRNYTNAALRAYIKAGDFDHWMALNLIAARLHRERQLFPEALADWAAEFHEDKHQKPPAKEKGNAGAPPYAYEDRNGVYAMADNWLEHYGMTHDKDRLAAIAGITGDDEDVVRKGLRRWRDPSWRRAPWPGLPADC